MSDRTSNQGASAFLAWLETPEGKAAVADAERASRDTRELLEKGHHVPWEKLHEPFTI